MHTAVASLWGPFVFDVTDQIRCIAIVHRIEKAGDLKFGLRSLMNAPIRFKHDRFAQHDRRVALLDCKPAHVGGGRQLDPR